jgi:hypothetical protein
MLSSGEPTGISPVSQDYVNFMLQFDSSNKEERAEWVTIFAAVRNASDHRVLLSVGNIKNREAFASDIYATFELYPWFSSLALFLVFVLFVALVWLARRTELLRDSHSLPNADAPNAVKPNSPYSLGRVQMAWWFYLVIASYVYIWLVTQVPYRVRSRTLGNQCDHRPGGRVPRS